MDDIKRALLGDKEAAKRMTDAGVLLPCWRCGGESELQEIHTGGKPVYAVSCKKHHCGAYGCAHQTKKNAVAYWNTRAPILSESELKKLEESGEEDVSSALYKEFRLDTGMEAKL